MAYLVKAFAQLAGVTVRTLHYYDRIDLLKPSDLTEAGHRVYTKSDLVRLQQILLLKWMGFSLTQIKEVLDNPEFDLRQTLIMQQRAVHARIQELNDAATMLEEAIVATEASGEEALSPELVTRIIKTVFMDDNWFAQFYSEDALSGIMTRRLNYSQDEIQASRQAWQDLIAEFEKVRDKAPDNPDVQTLAAEMYDLINEFTGGDPETLHGLESAYSHYDEFPEQYRMADKTLLQFMNRAYSIYQKTVRQ